MAVLLVLHETLFLSIELVETRFLPPSIVLEWRGFAGVGITQAIEDGSAIQMRCETRALDQTVNRIFREENGVAPVASASAKVRIQLLQLANEALLDCPVAPFEMWVYLEHDRDAPCYPEPAGGERGSTDITEFLLVT